MRTTLDKTPLAGVLIVTIDYFEDARGFFIENWNRRDFAAAGLDVEFVQEGHSSSRSKVIRGLHFQDSRAPMGKLVRCTVGAIFDVAVDMRASSPAFGQWFGIELSAQNKKQLWIPGGFAHGFATLSESAEVQYKQTHHYQPEAEQGIMWNDPDIGVKWPYMDPVLSKRDYDQGSFRDYKLNPAFV